MRHEPLARGALYGGRRIRGRRCVPQPFARWLGSASIRMRPDAPSRHLRLATPRSAPWPLSRYVAGAARADAVATLGRHLDDTWTVAVHAARSAAVDDAGGTS
jgi:hypothetical protein